MTDFLCLVLHLACKVTFYFQLFSWVLVSVLRTSINMLSKSKSRNYVTWIANLTKLFLSVYRYLLVLVSTYLDKTLLSLYRPIKTPYPNKCHLLAGCLASMVQNIWVFLPQNERKTYKFCSVCIYFEESVFTFQFLNGKTHNYVKKYNCESYSSKIEK